MLCGWCSFHLDSFSVSNQVKWCAIGCKQRSNPVELWSAVGFTPGAHNSPQSSENLRSPQGAVEEEIGGSRPSASSSNGSSAKLCITVLVNPSDIWKWLVALEDASKVREALRFKLYQHSSSAYRRRSSLEMPKAHHHHPCEAPNAAEGCYFTRELHELEEMKVCRNGQEPAQDILN